MKPKVSVIIATYNSEKLLPKVLDSVKRQVFPSSQIEILVVDGGSNDGTLTIAREYKCRILTNSRTEPVYGKYLAYTKARGRYLMYLDHDEVLLNKHSIAKKVDCFKNNPGLKVVLGSGYTNPQSYPFVNRYINEFGDPFSFFIYRLSKLHGRFISQMRKRCSVLDKNKDWVVFDLSKIKSMPIIEITSIGSMFDAKVLRRDFPKTLKDMKLLPHYFYLLYSHYPYLGITKRDVIKHYSSNTFGGYLNKLKWRVKNNIFFRNSLGSSGFSGRQEFQSRWQNIRKFLFVPYSFSIILPTVDAVYLSITRKDWEYLTHIYLCLYMAFIIVFYYISWLLGYKPYLRSSCCL
jgi:glycosyltransferase involved in cell wall biosynthesis